MSNFPNEFEPRVEIIEVKELNEDELNDLTNIIYNQRILGIVCLHCGTPFPTAQELPFVPDDEHPVRSWIGYDEDELNLVHEKCFNLYESEKNVRRTK